MRASANGHLKHHTHSVSQCASVTHSWIFVFSIRLSRHVLRCAAAVKISHSQQTMGDGPRHGPTRQTNITVARFDEPDQKLSFYYYERLLKKYHISEEHLSFKRKCSLCHAVAHGVTLAKVTKLTMIHCIYPKYILLFINCCCCCCSCAAFSVLVLFLFLYRCLYGLAKGSVSLWLVDTYSGAPSQI